MELLEGRSLEALRRERGGTLGVAESIRHAEALLEVLEHTHGLGVTHRDLKPSNLFLTERGELKVLDFGIATAAADERFGGTESVTRGILGTPAFMPPEQARGRWDLVDQRADLWAAGAVLFTLLSGQYVHVAGTENERLGLAMSRPARPIRSVVPGLARAVGHVVDRALLYEVASRWQTARAFREALLEASITLPGKRGWAPSADVTLVGEGNSRDEAPKTPGSRLRAGTVAALAAAVAGLALAAEPRAGVQAAANDRSVEIVTPNEATAPRRIVVPPSPPPLPRPTERRVEPIRQHRAHPNTRRAERELPISSESLQHLGTAARDLLDRRQIPKREPANTDGDMLDARE
jgi:serine/threonine protein kinase